MEKTPKNLDECMELMLKEDDSKDLEVFKNLKEEKVIGKFHFHSGMAMRNNWGLWGKNELTSFFNNLGIFHADDMSGIIYTSFHRHINNKNIKLKEQVKFYINYWTKMGCKDGNPKNEQQNNSSNSCEIRE